MPSDAWQHILLQQASASWESNSTLVSALFRPRDPHFCSLHLFALCALSPPPLSTCSASKINCWFSHTRAHNLMTQASLSHATLQFLLIRWLQVKRIVHMHAHARSSINTHTNSQSYSGPLSPLGNLFTVSWGRLRENLIETGLI